MIKKNFFVLLVCILAVIALFAACNAPTPAPAPTPTPAPAPAPKAPSEKVIELSLNLCIPNQHLRVTDVIQPWIEEVAKRTGGRVKIVPYFSSVLGPAPEILDATQAGLCDLGEVNFLQCPGRMPLNEVLCLGINQFSATPSAIVWELFEEFPALRAEYPNVKLLAATSESWTGLNLRNKRVTTLEDLKGLKIWAGGKWGTEWVKALGATPATTPVADLYSAMDKGVVDGMLMGFAILKSRMYAEVTKYLVEVTSGWPSFVYIMNLDKWNSLPPDVQKVFEELGGRYLVDKQDAVADRQFQEVVKWAITNYGIEYIQLSPEEMARWVKCVEGVRRAYTAELDAKGLPGTKTLAEFLRLCDKYSGKLSVYRK